VLTPTLFQSGGRYGDEATHSRLVRKSLIAVTFTTIPLSSLLILSSDVVGWIYGKPFVPAAHVLILLTSASAIASISGPITSAVLSKGRSTLISALGIGNALMCYLLLKSWLAASSALGLALAVLIAQWLHTLLLVEISIFRRMLPQRTRIFFWSITAILSIVATLGWCAPAFVRYSIGVPLAITIVIVMMRIYPDIADWLYASSPRMAHFPIRFLQRISGRGILVSPEIKSE